VISLKESSIRPVFQIKSVFLRRVEGLQPKVLLPHDDIVLDSNLEPVRVSLQDHLYKDHPERFFGHKPGRNASITH
jgi:hypothetical protein